MSAATAMHGYGTRSNHDVPVAGGLSAWMAAAVVLALLVGSIATAWLQPGGNGQRQMAWAPQVASPLAEQALTPDTAPWIADFSTEDCALPPIRPADLQARGTAAAPAHQSYALGGDSNVANNEAAATTYRAMRGCPNMAGAWACFSETLLAIGNRNLTAQTQSDLAALQEHFQADYPTQFMTVVSGVTVPAQVQDEWSARASFGYLGQPVPIGARINPEWGVPLADGRIAFPSTVIYSDQDPAIVASGLPTLATQGMVMVFSPQGGEWKYDESLLMCLTPDCEGGVGNPLDPADYPWMRPADPDACTVGTIEPSDLRDRTLTMPAWQDREYTVTGPADAADAEAAVETLNMFMNCDAANKRSGGNTLMTDLGLVMIREPRGMPISAGDRSAYRQANATNAMRMAADHPELLDMAVTIDLAAYQGMSYEGRIPQDGGMANRDFSGFPYGGAITDPGRAVSLSDGLIAIGQVLMQPIDSRPVNMYGGIFADFSGPYARSAVFILKNEEGQWKLDEVLILQFGAGQATSVRDYWYGPGAPAATPVASPVGERSSGRRG